MGGVRGGRDGIPDTHHRGDAPLRARQRALARRGRCARVRAPVLLRNAREQRVRGAVPGRRIQPVHDGAGSQGGVRGESPGREFLRLPLPARHRPLLPCRRQPPLLPGGHGRPARPAKLELPRPDELRRQHVLAHGARARDPGELDRNERDGPLASPLFRAVALPPSHAARLHRRRERGHRPGLEVVLRPDLSIRRRHGLRGGERHLHAGQAAPRPLREGRPPVRGTAARAREAARLGQRRARDPEGRRRASRRGPAPVRGREDVSVGVGRRGAVDAVPRAERAASCRGDRGPR